MIQKWVLWLVCCLRWRMMESRFVNLNRKSNYWFLYSSYSLSNALRSTTLFTFKRLSFAMNFQVLLQIRIRGKSFVTKFARERLYFVMHLKANTYTINQKKSCCRRGEFLPCQYESLSWNAFGRFCYTGYKLLLLRLRRLVRMMMTAFWKLIFGPKYQTGAPLYERPTNLRS